MGSPTIPKQNPLKRMVTPTDSVLVDIARERGRQRAKWGMQNHRDYTPETETLVIDELEAKMLCIEAQQRGLLSWVHILGEEVAEAIHEAMNGRPDLLREELVQVAAVACAWIEALDRRKKLQEALKRTNTSQSEKIGG